MSRAAAAVVVAMLASGVFAQQRAIPLDQVAAKMAEHCARVLPALGTPAAQGPEFMRHLILAGRLFDRLIFQVYGVPKQRAHRI